MPLYYWSILQQPVLSKLHGTGLTVLKTWKYLVKKVTCMHSMEIRYKKEIQLLIIMCL